MVGTALKWSHRKPHGATHTSMLSEKGTLWGTRYQRLWPGSARAASYLEVSPRSTCLATSYPALQILWITCLRAIALVLLWSCSAAGWVNKHTGLQHPPRDTGRPEPADAPWEPRTCIVQTWDPSSNLQVLIKEMTAQFGSEQKVVGGFGFFQSNYVISTAYVEAFCSVPFVHTIKNSLE